MCLSCLAAIKFFSLPLVSSSGTWTCLARGSINFLSLDRYHSSVWKIPSYWLFNYLYGHILSLPSRWDSTYATTGLPEFTLRVPHLFSPWLSLCVPKFWIFHWSVFLFTNPAVINLLLNTSIEALNLRYLSFSWKCPFNLVFTGSNSWFKICLLLSLSSIFSCISWT